MLELRHSFPGNSSWQIAEFRNTDEVLWRSNFTKTAGAGTVDKKYQRKINFRKSVKQISKGMASADIG